MKIIKKILLLTTFILIIMAAFSKVNAASANISTNKTSMKVGETATITVSYTAAAWNIQVTGAVSYSSADTSSDAKNTSKSANLKFAPKKAGRYSVTLSGDVTDQDGTIKEGRDIEKTINITVKEKNTNTNTTSDNTENNTANTANNEALLKDATLKNLGIRPNDFSGFRKAILSYSVSVPKNVDKVSIYAEATNPKATVTGTGTKTLQIGKNTFSIKVTAEDKKTTKTYTLVITRKNEDENASDATLTNLGIRPKEYDFTGFRMNTMSYSVSVPNDVEKITIYATAKSEKATITGIGSKTLKVGANRCEIKVTSENKKATKTYVINVTRKEQEEKTEENEDETDEENNNKDEEVEEKLDEEKLSDGLKNIDIKGYDIEPSFSQDIYSYKVDIPSCNGELEIDTETTGDDIEVEVAGNEDIRQGENIITILVHNKKDDSTKTYQITANVEKFLSAENEDTNDSGNKIKTWGIIGAISAIIIVMIIIFIRKYKRENEEYFDGEDDDENIYEKRNDYYNQTDRYEEQTEDERTSKTNEDLRNIGLYDDTQKIEYDDYDEPKRHGKYKGRRFK